MTSKLVLENMKHRPLRSLLSILLIGVPVTLILTLVGLSRGMIQDSINRQRGVGADLLVRPPGSSAMTLSGAPIPEKLSAKLAEDPRVATTVGVIGHPVSGFTYVAGIRLDEFARMSGGFRYLQGGPFRRPDDIIIDEYYAQQQKVRAGDTMNMLNRDWHVAGVVEVGKLSHVILPMEVVQDLTGNTGKISQVFIKLKDPRQTQAVVTDLKERMPGYNIYSMEEFTSLINANSVPQFNSFLNIVQGIGVVIGFAVVCLSMYMAVLQRTREFGILKSLGASRSFILKLILTEAVLMGIGGTILGILLSFVSRWVFWRSSRLPFPRP